MGDTLLLHLFLRFSLKYRVENVANHVLLLGHQLHGLLRAKQRPKEVHLTTKQEALQ